MCVELIGARNCKLHNRERGTEFIQGRGMNRAKKNDMEEPKQIQANPMANKIGDRVNQIAIIYLINPIEID